jgi:UDP-glucuronate decarboxylase
VADIVARRNVILKSDGGARRAFCYLADSTVGIFTVLLRGKSGEAYNLGAESEISILELAERLCEMFPERGCKVVRRERAPTDPYIPSALAGGHFDLSKIKLLGWKPCIGIEEGFRRTILSYE